MNGIADLIRSGALIPVQVFGGDTEGAGRAGVEHCSNCGHEVPWSFGLSDRFSKWAPGGSDCNRAEFFLLRPNDLTFNDAPVEDLEAIRAAIEEVLDD